MLDLLCGQLSMYCTLDNSSLGIWVLFMMQFLSFCGLESHMSRGSFHKTLFAFKTYKMWCLYCLNWRLARQEKRRLKRQKRSILNTYILAFYTPKSVFNFFEMDPRSGSFLAMQTEGLKNYFQICVCLLKTVFIFQNSFFFVCDQILINSTCSDDILQTI